MTDGMNDTRSGKQPPLTEPGKFHVADNLEDDEKLVREGKGVGVDLRMTDERLVEIMTISRRENKIRRLHKKYDSLKKEHDEWTHRFFSPY